LKCIASLGLGSGNTREGLHPGNGSDDLVEPVIAV
jgi:hypothetical protein